MIVDAKLGEGFIENSDILFLKKNVYFEMILILFIISVLCFYRRLSF